MALSLPAVPGALTLAALGRLLGEWRQRLERQRLPALSEQGVAVRGVTVTTTPAEIPHGLGARPSGWVITRAQGTPAAVAEVTSNATTITLVATAPVTLDLWVWP